MTNDKWINQISKIMSKRHNILPTIATRFFYKQHQAEIGKKN